MAIADEKHIMSLDVPQLPCSSRLGSMDGHGTWIRDNTAKP